MDSGGEECDEYTEDCSQKCNNIRMIKYVQQYEREEHLILFQITLTYVGAGIILCYAQPKLQEKLCMILFEC
jgi:hypothetical protein